MKKCIQIVIKIIISLLIVQFTFYPTSQASFWDEIINLGDSFIDIGKEKLEEDATIDTDNMRDEYMKLFRILFSLGVVLTVIIGAILGIKFMFGGIDEQVKVKEMLVPYIVGCIIIFGAFGIWRLVIQIISNVT